LEPKRKGNVQIYHMTLREGGRGLLKLSEYRYLGGGGLAKSSYKFYSG